MLINLVKEILKRRFFLVKPTGAGFTLMELLIVIIIIGVLASLIFANFAGVRQRGRDSQRKSDLKQIQTALELYRADNGSYPISIGPGEATNWFLSTEGAGRWLSALTPNHMKTVPVDPINTSSGWPWNSDSYKYGYYSGTYCSQTAGTSYILVALLENTSDPDAGKPIYYGTCNWLDHSQVIMDSRLYGVTNP